MGQDGNETMRRGPLNTPRWWEQRLNPQQSQPESAKALIEVLHGSFEKDNVVQHKLNCCCHSIRSAALMVYRPAASSSVYHS